MRNGLLCKPMTKRRRHHTANSRCVALVEDEVKDRLTFLDLRISNVHWEDPFPVEEDWVPRRGLDPRADVDKFCRAVRTRLHQTKHGCRSRRCCHAVAPAQSSQWLLGARLHRDERIPAETSAAPVVVHPHVSRGGTAHRGGWRSHGWRRPGWYPLHQISSGELRVIVRSLEGSLRIRRRKSHSNEHIDFASVHDVRRRQFEEHVVSEVTRRLEKFPPIHLHARVLEVVALLREVGARKRQQVMRPPIFVPLILR
mmetsp:Transcript_106291/g.299054  ORF Transcript_106291/g.299054 Transcript_106291/m.299054 type:complete len:255 (-) Transcript_106291:1233-1997(-)